MVNDMILKELRKKEFKNGVVYLLETYDGYQIEVTDTFLPYYTKAEIDTGAACGQLSIIEE